MPASRPGSVYLYGTCLADLFDPEAGLAAIRLLEREGVQVLYPKGQTCCGQPAFNAGYPDDARAVARAQIRLFPGEQPIVVPSGSCAGMMKRHYTHLFEGDPFEAEAAAFSLRVVELTEFLVDVLGVRLVDRGTPVAVTWHPSCHSLRESGVDHQPRSLLAQLANVEVRTLPRESECCGFGGTFSVRFPEISAAMASDKAAAVVGTSAPVLLSGDGGCLLNIAGVLEAMGASPQPIRACHVARFLWERTREA